MKTFDAKWRTAAAHARQATRREEQAPFGFVPRVAARAFLSEPAPLDSVWTRPLARLLAGAVAVLLVCVAVEWPHLRDSRPLEPGIENAVAQIVWSL